jgi:Holliday junction resolvase
MSKQTRSPKQMGDFGEGLVTYALIRKGFEVAYVDHVGADLIAEKAGKRIAVSVKTRLFRPGSTESRMMVFEFSALDKLQNFAQQFGMDPVFAQVVCLADDRIIHLFMIRVEEIPQVLPKVGNGYSIRFSNKRIKDLTNNDLVDYCCWKDENIGGYDFA